LDRLKRLLKSLGKGVRADFMSVVQGLGHLLRRDLGLLGGHHVFHSVDWGGSPWCVTNIA
jgi:hypothetical protein